MTIQDLEQLHSAGTYAALYLSPQSQRQLAA